jgi:hypothetical protein
LPSCSFPFLNVPFNRWPATPAVGQVVELPRLADSNQRAIVADCPFDHPAKKRRNPKTPASLGGRHPQGFEAGRHYRDAGEVAAQLCEGSG